MTDRDLTPAEARAEVEAFLGPEWNVRAIVPPDYNDRCYMAAFIPCSRAGDFKVRVESPCCPTYRAAVDALKQAWRDAIRPWMEAAIEAKLDTADVDGYAPDEVVIARVCEKGMENV